MSGGGQATTPAHSLSLWGSWAEPFMADGRAGECGRQTTADPGWDSRGDRGVAVLCVAPCSDLPWIGPLWRRPSVMGKAASAATGHRLQHAGRGSPQQGRPLPHVMPTWPSRPHTVSFPKPRSGGSLEDSWPRLQWGVGHKGATTVSAGLRQTEDCRALLTAGWV